MNILLINANNPYKASGIVALNLFNDFKLKGHNVKLLTNKYDAHYAEGIISMETRYKAAWKSSKLRYKFDGLQRKLNLKKDTRVDNKYDFFEFNEKKKFYKTKNLLKKAELNPDIIIILFAKKFINTKNIYEFYERTHAKIYWLMYDMAPLTGGCHYAWECKGYESHCGNCPGLFSSDPCDITHQNVVYKQNYINRSNIQLIAASEWQYRQAIASSLFRNKKTHKILLSVDPHIFKPVCKEEKKKTLGIPSNKKVIFFGSIELTTVRKGMFYLLASLKILKEKIKDTSIENDVLLVIAGKKIEEIADKLPFEYHSLGLVDNTYGIASAYQIADVFICPSIEDSGPTMVNQSIMSGTPVVCFEMGIALDLVFTGKTGYRAKIKDSEDLAQGLYNILTLQEDDYKELSNNCRELALRECSPQVQIESFEKIFKN